MSTAIISLILALIAIGIVRNLIKNKKAGRTSCGCGCEHCALKGECHKN